MEKYIRKGRGKVATDPPVSARLRFCWKEELRVKMGWWFH
jgi:hypothetical protein